MFKTKSIICAALVIGALGSVTLPIPVMAATTVIRIDRAPPAPREERIPEARRGYIWAPGYWNWRGNRHVWVQGSWVRERRGYAYAAPVWAERDGHWVLNRGHWEHNR